MVQHIMQMFSVIILRYVITVLLMQYLISILKFSWDGLSFTFMQWGEEWDTEAYIAQVWT
jgi:hypothetical protein